MKKTIYGMAAAGVILFSAFTAKEETFKADTKLSSLEWTGKKLTGEHSGIIMLTAGEIKISNDAVIGGTFEIDMASLVDKDLQDPAYKAKLEGHLKSAEFFDVAKFPKAKYEITSVTPLKDAKEGAFTHHVKGNLMLKDKTNPVEFDAVIKMADGKVACVGTATIDRSKFDVKYGSKSFFPEIGDKIIYDEFKVKFNVVATKN